jgi:hypothetical protein
MLRRAPAVRTAVPAIAIVASVVLWSVEPRGKPQDLLLNPPELHAKNHALSLTLHAAITNEGKNSFYFNGQPNAPTLRLLPGDQLKIAYINDLPTRPQESCFITPCMDMTNLHFHGLTVSPDAPQDDVLTMMAAPGQSLRYTVRMTLLLAEIDAQKRTLRYINCGHNPALLFRAETGSVTRMESSCPPIGMFEREACDLISTDLIPGDMLVFYTDGVTEAANRSAEEFGTERLSAVLQRGSSLPAEALMTEIYKSAADFCGEAGFKDDVTILVVKCEFDASQGLTSPLIPE